VLVLDTSLLSLFVVGSAGRDLIGKHKRLREFTVDDFDLLRMLIAEAGGLVITPNTLTETSNWLGYIDEPARTRIYEMFRLLIAAGNEQYVQSNAAALAAEFTRLGLTDVVVMEVSQAPRSLLTTDLDLYLAALDRGLAAVNFNHIRAEFGLV
jgi:hypothetical protein